MNKWMKLLHMDSRIQKDVHDGPLIKLENLVKIYDTGAIKALGLKKINLIIERGELMAIMGHSGSGKSIPMGMLGYLDRPTLGHYYPDGIDVMDMRPDQLPDIRNRKIGSIFQPFNLISKTSAPKDVELSTTYARVPRAKRAVKVQLFLERVELGAREGYTLNELSSGQRQRVAVARALANEPPLILADEPTGNLDTASSVEIMELFTKLHQEGVTVVLVTHEGDIAALAHHAIRFSDGQTQSDKLNVARVVSRSGRGGEQDAD